MYIVIILFFFFSSRRRHTRLQGDWSSDVCSSDLVYVTHDHHEALILADLIAVMDRGHIEQVGTPQAIYEAPKNVFVAGFLNLNVGTPPLSLIDAPLLPEHRD